MILPTSDVQGAPIILTKFPVGLSVQERKHKIYFQDGHHSGYLEFLIETIFLSKNRSDTSYQVSSQLIFAFRRRSK